MKLKVNKTIFSNQDNLPSLEEIQGQIIIFDKPLKIMRCVRDAK